MDDTTKALLDDKMKVLRLMRDVTEFDSSGLSLTSVRQLLASKTGIEMVGMVPKASLSLVLDWLSAVGRPSSPIQTLESLNDFDASVRALGVFSREKLKDDARGSLRKQIVEHYGSQFADQSSQQFDVFAIEGLLDAPDLSKSSAAVLISKISEYAQEGLDAPDLSNSSVRVLVSKIAQYAHQEKKVVVVPDRAYRSNGGMTDLTEYYVRLGFQKVEMQGGAQVLLYTGHWQNTLVPDGPHRKKTLLSVENNQIMVGMNLWELR